MRAGVIGAGLAGCAAALALEAAGFEVTVFEAAESPRRGGHSLSLFPRATAALAALGVNDVPGVALTRITTLHQTTGRTLNVIDMTRVAEFLGGFSYVVVPREELVDLLLSRVGAVQYGQRCDRVTTTDSYAEVHLSDGANAAFDLVVAADGSSSGVRAALWPGEERKFLSVVWQTTVELPKGYPSPTEAVIARGPCVFAGAFPTTGGRVNLFFDRRAEDGSPAEVPASTALAGLQGLPEPMRTWFTDTPLERFEAYPIFVRRPPRRWSRGRVTLLGDAAHSLSPSGGQGSSEAFNDAVALGEAVDRDETLDQALSAYSRERYRTSTTNWHLSTWPLRPVTSRLLTASLRMTPDFFGVRGSRPFFGPIRVVRRVLATTPGIRPS